MSVSPKRGVMEATEAFRGGLEKAWRVRREQEEEIARTHAAVSAQVTALLEAIARAVSEVTGQEARVDEMKRTFNTAKRTLLTHHAILHPSGDFHVRVHYGPECIEYHRERVERSETEVLFDRIVRDALAHFGPKPI